MTKSIGHLSLYITLLLLSCKSGQNETFIVPKELRGYIFIVHNDNGNHSNNKEKVSLGQDRVFYIPKSGILFTEIPISNKGISRTDAFILEGMQRIPFEAQLSFRKDTIPFDGVKLYWIKTVIMDNSVMRISSMNECGYSLLLLSDFKNLNVYRNVQIEKALDLWSFDSINGNINNWKSESLIRIIDSCMKATNSHYYMNN